MKKKTKKKVGFIIAAAITIPTAIIVFALLYFSNTAINPFHEGKANIQIQENKESPSDMIDDIAMKWEKSESFDYYECDKLVTLTSQYDDQNLRLMLIPSWWKENTPVAGLVDNSYNDFSYMRINRTTVGYTVDNANNLRKSNRIFRRSNFPLMRTKRTLKRTIRFDRNGLTHTK